MPLLRTRFDSFRTATESDTLRLEKSIDRLDGRIDIFATATITLVVGIFTAVLAPLFVSFWQRRAGQQPDSDATLG